MFKYFFTFDLLLRKSDFLQFHYSKCRAVGSSSILRGPNLKRALYVSDVGSPTMVGADAPREVLILNPLEWLKTAFP